MNTSKVLYFEKIEEFFWSHYCYFESWTYNAVHKRWSGAAEFTKNACNGMISW